MYLFSIVVIENLYIQTSLMVALSLFRVKEGGGTFINQRWTLITDQITNSNLIIGIPLSKLCNQIVQ